MKADNLSSLQSTNYKQKKGVSIEEAYERIKHLISVNQLVPGQKLLYRDLAKRLNIGVTPIVQALNRLVELGLVRHDTNKGYFVDEISESEARQLYQAREAIEVYAISFVIANIDPVQLTKIEERFRINSKADLSQRELILGDIRFHLAIVRHSQNDVIYKLLKGILEQVYLKYWPMYLDDKRIQVIRKEHKDLLTHIKNKDVAKAITLIRDHNKSGMEHVIKTIQSEKQEN